MEYYKLHVSNSAEEDILNATDYYDQINQNLGDRFLTELYEIYENLNPNFAVW